LATKVVYFGFSPIQPRATVESVYRCVDVEFKVKVVLTRNVS